ncbi:MAG TPA: ribosome biogenesis GTPase Der [Planctomycetota bacterium]
MDKLPVVVIVGRQNVGKSSLMNAMAQNRTAIVEPTPGVTRDRVSSIVAYGGRAFELVDTGGIGLKQGDPFFEEVERQIENAIAEATVVVFVVDAQAGLTSLDRRIASRFRDKTVVLVANKADNSEIEKNLPDFYALGFGAALPAAAAHRRNTRDLLEKLSLMMPPAAVPPRGLRIAVVGKRNVGKSTFVNAVAGEERVIVSEIPGTTRDAVDVVIERDAQRYVLIDTAGLRKRQKVENAIELFSQVRTEEAIQRSDVVVFMLDIMEKVSEVDKRIAGALEKEKRPAVVVLNKYDLVPAKNTPDEFLKYVTKAMPVLLYAPVLMISAKKGMRVWDVMQTCVELNAQAGVKIPTPELNRALDAAVRARSPSGRGPRAAKIYYVAQKGTRPPRFIVFVNDARSFAPDYVRYLENKLREYLPFHEVPISLELRGKQKRPVDRRR